MKPRQNWMGWAFLLCAILGVGLAWKARSPHRAIAMSDVVRFELKPKDARHGHELTPTEAEQVLEWFNSADGIVDNSHHGAPGCGTYSTLLFHLKSGDVVTVYSFMRVTRGKPGSSLDQLSADYYFKQPDLERYLRDWDAKADAGC